MNADLEGQYFNRILVLEDERDDLKAKLDKAADIADLGGHTCSTVCCGASVIRNKILGLKRGKQ